jgi:hypothetical protein
LKIRISITLIHDDTNALPFLISGPIISEKGIESGFGFHVGVAWKRGKLGSVVFFYGDMEAPSVARARC